MSAASITIVLDGGPNFSAIAGSSFVVTGTVSLSPDWQIGASTLDNPGRSGGGFVPTSFAPEFLAYMLPAPTVGYSGPLFSVDVPSSTLPGLYDVGSGGLGDPADFTISGSDTATFQSFTAKAPFSVTVQAVPEPASMAALGLGVAALLRRRKRS